MGYTYILKIPKYLILLLSINANKETTNMFELNYDYAKWKTHLQDDWKFKLPVPDTETFLQHALQILSCMPIQRNPNNGLISASLMADNMPESIDTGNGTITGTNLRNLVLVLYFTPRSGLIKKMVSNPELASLTPLVLYAFKLYHNINYEEWDKTDPKLKFFLGKFLESILSDNAIDPQLSVQEIIELRGHGLTYKTGKKAGQQASLVSNKMNFNVLHGNLVPKVTMYMYLQTWLANVSCRNTNSMILDPFNWDNVPEAVDQGIDVDEQLKKDRKKKIEKAKQSRPEREDELEF